MAGDGKLVVDPVRDDGDRAHQWRVEQLVRAGFTRQDAGDISRSGGDYQKAIAMRKAGCPSELVVLILV